MLWWPVVTVLITLPYFVWEDWKFRELSDTSMAGLFVINFPFLTWAYVYGGFGWEEVVVSALPVCIYYLIMRFANEYFHGDDFIYMSIVSLCLVVNPMHPFSSAIPVKILIYMGGVAVLVAAVNLVINVISQRNAERDIVCPEIQRTPFLSLINKFDGGFPMMFVFAPTIILALIL